MPKRAGAAGSTGLATGANRKPQIFLPVPMAASFFPVAAMIRRLLSLHAAQRGAIEGYPMGSETIQRRISASTNSGASIGM